MNGNKQASCAAQMMFQIFYCRVLVTLHYKPVRVRCQQDVNNLFSITINTYIVTFQPAMNSVFSCPASSYRFEDVLFVFALQRCNRQA